MKVFCCDLPSLNFQRAIWTFLLTAIILGFNLFSANARPVSIFIDAKPPRFEGKLISIKQIEVPKNHKNQLEYSNVISLTKHDFETVKKHNSEDVSYHLRALTTFSEPSNGDKNELPNLLYLAHFNQDISGEELDNMKLSFLDQNNSKLTIEQLRSITYSLKGKPKNYSFAAKSITIQTAPDRNYSTFKREYDVLYICDNEDNCNSEKIKRKHSELSQFLSKNQNSFSPSAEGKNPTTNLGETTSRIGTKQSASGNSEFLIKGKQIGDEQSNDNSKNDAENAVPIPRDIGYFGALVVIRDFREKDLDKRPWWAAISANCGSREPLGKIEMTTSGYLSLKPKPDELLPDGCIYIADFDLSLPDVLADATLFCMRANNAETIEVSPRVILDKKYQCSPPPKKIKLSFELRGFLGDDGSKQNVTKVLEVLESSGTSLEIGVQGEDENKRSLLTGLLSTSREFLNLPKELYKAFRNNKIVAYFNGKEDIIEVDIDEQGSELNLKIPPFYTDLKDLSLELTSPQGNLVRNCEPVLKLPSDGSIKLVNVKRNPGPITLTQTNGLYIASSNVRNGRLIFSDPRSNAIELDLGSDEECRFNGKQIISNLTSADFGGAKLTYTVGPVLKTLLVIFSQHQPRLDHLQLPLIASERTMNALVGELQNIIDAGQYERFGFAVRSETLSEPKLFANQKKIDRFFEAESGEKNIISEISEAFVDQSESANFSFKKDLRNQFLQIAELKSTDISKMNNTDLLILSMGLNIGSEEENRSSICNLLTNIQLGAQAARDFPIDSRIMVVSVGDKSENSNIKTPFAEDGSQPMNEDEIVGYQCDSADSWVNEDKAQFEGIVMEASNLSSNALRRQTTKTVKDKIIDFFGSNANE
ncbi:hypothetical protein [Lentilitoribacter sp. EG35]|uniref:hypothetical protein n=1 Tax=Lentilitoribacter sp. EG35 TaxID=3234192 RepID=UPI00345F5D77